jgi:hypothetical protein
VNIALGQVRARRASGQIATNGAHTQLTPPNGKAAPIDEGDAALRLAVLKEREARASLVETQLAREAGKLIRRVDVLRAAEVAAEQIVTVLENVGTLANAGRIRAAVTDVAGRAELKKAIRRARAKISDAFMELANAEDNGLRPHDG